MGRLIVLDGLDGSGKETQTNLLGQALIRQGKKVRTLSFPCYESDSSLFVRMYLNGQLGSRPEDTNAYAASSFFAMDRYLSYRTDWQKDYLDDRTIVLANRYTTANAVHQLSKLPKNQWDGFLSWLWDFEFQKLGLPLPNDTVYLEMHPDISLRLIHKRSDETGRTVDIHENEAFLRASYEAALYCAEKLHWHRIVCHKNGEPLPRGEIHRAVLSSLGIDESFNGK